MEPLLTDLSPSRKQSIGVDQGSSLYNRKVAHTKGTEERETDKDKDKDKDKNKNKVMNEREDVNTRRRVTNNKDEEIESEGYQKQATEKKKEGEQVQVGEKILFTLIIITCICWIQKIFSSFMG